MDKVLDSPIKVIGGIVVLVETILTLILTTGKSTDEQKLWIIIGMIASVILALIAAVIIHWIDNKKISISSSIDTDEKKYLYDIFISFPMASVPKSEKRKNINNFANELESKLKELGYKDIFNASTHFGNNVTPRVAVEIDFEALDKSKNLLFIYPLRVPTSALIELGYALANKKNIIICTTNINILPFLARGLSRIFNVSDPIIYTDNQNLIDIFIKSHSHYIKK